MIIYNYIYYITITLIFELRRRLPLYSDDHARINTAYAYAVLKYFQSSQLSLKVKRKLFEKYAKRFSMPIAVERMANTLYCDPQRTEFLKLLSAEEMGISAERLKSRVLHTLGKMHNYAPTQKPNLKERLTQPIRPSFSTRYAQLIYKGGKNREERFSVSDINNLSADSRSGSAILCLPLGRLVETDLQALKGYNKIIVIPQNPCDASKVKAGIKAALGAGISISFYSPKDNHAMPYSKEDAFVSKACDDLGMKFLESALGTASVRRFIPKILDEDLALSISDIIYRPLQRFYAALRSVETIGSTLPVYFSGPSNALPRTLAVIGTNPVYILSQGSGTVSDELSQDDWVLPPSSAEMVNGLHAFMKDMRKRIIAALPPIPRDGANHIYIATNTRAKSYELANNIIKQKLTDISPVTIFDFAAPKGIKNISKASIAPCLHNALHSADGSAKTLLSHFVLAGSHATLDERNLGSFPTSELKEIVSIALKRNIGSLVGNVILYRLMARHLKEVKNAQLLLLPGRHANIRCLARAFEAIGLPSLDVQVLLVSEMARYKPPMARRSVVIDSFARDRYVQEWGISSESIDLIGAINLDEDIKKALRLDRKANKKALLGISKGKTITFACQPMPDAEIMAAVEAISATLKPQKELHLCVKLHPSQSESLLDQINEYLMDKFKDKSRYTVLHAVAFAKVMSITDILVSYFSNVCLMAPSFNVPVITLPSSAPMPSLTFADMGLAVAAKTLDDFSVVLSTVLSNVNDNDKNLPPYPYLSKNPHMTKPDSLIRLASVIKREFN